MRISDWSSDVCSSDLVKYAYMIVILLAAFQALRRDPEARFLTWAMVSFLPLLVFQALSLALNMPTGAEDGDGLVWIGGFNHETAFSVALLPGCTVARRLGQGGVSPCTFCWATQL